MRTSFEYGAESQITPRGDHCHRTEIEAGEKANLASWRATKDGARF